MIFIPVLDKCIETWTARKDKYRTYLCTLLYFLPPGATVLFIWGPIENSSLQTTIALRTFMWILIGLPDLPHSLK